MVAAQKKRLNRLQEGGDSGSEDSEDHYASDEEMNQALRAGEEGGKVGVILSYTAGLKLKQKKERWTMAFMRLHNEWIISAIVRTAWAFAMWTSLTVREQASSRLEQVKELDSKYNEVHDQLAHVSSKLDLFRQGRVGTYSGKGRYDSDDEIEDDYVQLAAYTRKMNINWTKERLTRGCDQATKCFETHWLKHWGSMFYVWRQNVLKLKLLSHKYSLVELDKLELVSERQGAQQSLKEQVKENAALQDTVEKLKRELGKHRRDKAWMERFNSGSG
eukprot:TRINITY_DN38926_c0_g1_i1.p1 TRINITY_DN38926_c0_g1~~TRINITY_DN38926_c0_g1_i1.p1  ORF type:complete len:275 (+),score=89.90 TRINITY_DN38926_c0_g1_i1:143-967(+)